MPKDENNHRGRIQAQGNGLEESESWAQDKPPTVSEGLNILQRLREKITKSQLLERITEFLKAEKIIEQAGKNGGVDAKVSKTFKKKGTKDVRVDIEVIRGTAFVKNDNEEDDGE
jgi:hypothetical protein